jgi:Flp pilus assembly protein TadG
MNQSHFMYLRAAFGLHLERLRAAMRERDAGASAVELALITVGMIVIAGIIVAAIKVFVKGAQGNIEGNTP